ncbi:GNAT family N-acetyltransferase [Lacticigenium naphthae]|uniref:GNAT family N-acetyltransferase n=1 Tax=Lacticigenium naphthae TaxID=515351 RepID=UPI000427AF8D|nr:GNAT family N-acetyltransferase [Lacticigenium naphthae]
MTNTYKEYKHFDEDEVIALYQSVGWSSYYEHPQKLKQSFEHSLYTLAAFAENELVGLVRVVGDGVSIVYIQDLLVNPLFQHKGIGTELARQILTKYEAVTQLVLLTDLTEKTKQFYQGVGFKMVEDYDCRSFARIK